MADSKLDKAPATFRFIPDEASEDDFFGSHKRISDALANIIRDNHNLKVVGLLGPWGSGKSTVINLLDKDLKADTGGRKTFFFYYDAWLHQSDPPRRAFLEELIAFLIEHRLTTEGRWGDELARLNRQIEDTETSSTPLLTKTGRLILISFLLVPFGSKFVEHGWYEGAFVKDQTEFAKWAFSAGAAITLLPALTVAWVYLRRRNWKRSFVKDVWTKAFWSKAKPPHEDESVLSLLTHRSVEKQRNRVTRSPEPSTIEFQSIFREILAEVSADDRRFLFIVDNLDRLPEADAVSMWATIRSFFLGRGQSQQLPTVILPIDQDAVHRMYKATHADEAAGLAKSFMDKTFDLVFHVTKPVMSNWQRYLDRQLHHVFGDELPENAPYFSSSIYQTFLDIEKKASVTPREINTLVNELGVYWLQWRSEGIHFASLVYYLVFRKDIDEDIQAAIDVPKAGIQDTDPEWSTAIAALRFGATLNDARQIILLQPLRIAVSENDAEEFDRLTAIPGFDVIFGQYLDSETIKGTLRIDNAVALLAGAKRPVGPWTETAWRKLRASFMLDVKWPEVADDQVRTSKTLLDNCDSSSLPSLIASIASKLSIVPEAALKGTSGKQLLSVLRTLLRVAFEHSLQVPNVTVAGDPSTYIEIISQGDLEAAKRLRSGATADKLAAQFVLELNGEATAKRAEVAIATLRAADVNLQWPTIFEGAATAVESGQAALFGLAVNVLGLVRTAVEEPDHRIASLISHGSLNNGLAAAHAAKDVPAMAGALALSIAANAEAALPNGMTWAALLKQFLGLAIAIHLQAGKFGMDTSLENWTRVASTNFKYAELVRAITTAQAETGEFGPLNGKDIVDRFGSYQACVTDASLILVVTQVVSQEQFWTALATKPLQKVEQDLFRVCLGLDVSRPRASTTFMDALDRLSVTQWGEALRADDVVLDLAEKATSGLGAPRDLAGHLYDGLAALLPDVINDGGELRGRWLRAMGLLPQNSRQTLAKKVGDQIAAGFPVNMAFELLTFGEPSLLTEGALDENPDGAVRNFILPMVTGGEFAKLGQISAFAAPLIARSGETSRGAINEQMLARWRDPNDDSNRALEEIRQAWNLPAFVAL